MPQVFTAHSRIRTGAQFSSRRHFAPVQPTIRIRGITRDAIGVPLGGCTVHLFRTLDDVEIEQGVSDGSGNYSFIVGLGEQYYVVAYLPGSPDRAGTTLNTLVGV